LTLRLKLVLALVSLVTVAQGVFFAITYLEYRQSQYRNLDNQLRSSEPAVDARLDLQNGEGNGAGGNFGLGGGSVGNGSGQGDQGNGPGGGANGPQAVFSVPPGTFGEQLDGSGNLIGTSLAFGSSKAVPKLPSHISPALGEGRLFTVGAVSGSTQFRVFELSRPIGGTVRTTVVAIPTTEVVSALNRLLLIEAGGTAAVLLLLSAGSWLILRAGLRPLERMAGTARLISSGDLSPRVAPAGGAGEVAQLGLALNTMLDDIEAAFAERDATEQKLRQFLADASHELRTPLTSIQGFAELFRVSGDQARVDLPTILRRIEGEASRMRVLVEDLLLLARLDEHRPARSEPVDLTVLAADACTDAVATAPDRPVSLDAPESVVVMGDEAHLRQALGNLVTNALKHTPAGTAIEVSCRLRDGRAAVEVRDHGQGLDEESLAHVFDRFWQSDKARVGTGAGLGLSIVSAIASEHGGRASAANAPGGGALFSLDLPAADDAACERTPWPLPTG
jgi:two-component system OmpR family sensor kinase